MPTPPDDDLLRTAFRDVHATRLNGFTLLVALGDRRRAAATAGQAIAEGTQRVHDLRHPERAAAWLRAKVLQSLRRGKRIEAPSLDALRTLGVNEPLLAGLSGLSLMQRAAIVAASVECFAEADVETILDATPIGARRMVATARTRYLAAFAIADRATLGSGPLTDRVLMVAARGLVPPAARTARST